MERDNYWLRRRVSRRRVVQGSALGAVGAASLALVGCGGDDDDDDDDNGSNETPTSAGFATPVPTEDVDSGEIDKDGILRYRQNAIYSSINPYKGLDSGLLWGFYIYDHLWYTPRDTGEPELFLATSLEQPDATQIVAKIGESFFHDIAPVNGRQVTAQDIKASLESAAVQPSISNSSWWTLIFDGVDAPDDETVIIKLKGVDAWSFSSTNGGSPIASSILPEEFALDPSQMDNNLIGSGRYQFESHENGTNFKIRRHPNWRIEGEPWTAGVDWALIQDQAAAIAAFADNQIDALTLNNRLETEDLVNRLGDSIEIEEGLTTAVYTFQGRADGVWANPDVRRAINLGMDRQEFIDLIKLGDGVVTGPVPPPFTSQALPESEVVETFAKFDPTDANALLDAASFDRSVEYEIKYPGIGENYAQFAQIAQQQLNQNLGMNVKLVTEDLGTWLQQSLYGSNYNGFMAYIGLAYDDPSSYIGAYAKEIGGRPNWAAFFDDEMDAAYVAQKGLLDDEERFAALLDIQRQAYEKAAPFWPVFVSITNTAHQGHVKGRLEGRGSFGLFNGQTYIDQA